MTTLRFEDNIFTADHIELITPLEEHIPKVHKLTMYDAKKDIVEAEKKGNSDIPFVKFQIKLVSGNVFSKRFEYECLSDEIKQQVDSKIKEIENECGFTELNDIKDRKNEIVRNQEYEAAARLRDEERLAWEKLEDKGYHKRIKKEVIEGIIIKGLRAVAEDKRTWIEGIVKSAKSPVIL